MLLQSFNRSNAVAIGAPCSSKILVLFVNFGGYVLVIVNQVITGYIGWIYFSWVMFYLIVIYRLICIVITCYFYAYCYIL